jgi:hypothetical protein
VRTELLCGDEDAPDQHWHHETLHELNCDQQAPRLEFKFELQQLTARHNTLVKRVRRHGSIRRVVRAACGSCGVCEADC